jgi:protein-disulfide isomerase
VYSWSAHLQIFSLKCLVNDDGRCYEWGMLSRPVRSIGRVLAAGALWWWGTGCGGAPSSEVAAPQGSAAPYTSVVIADDSAEAEGDGQPAQHSANRASAQAGPIPIDADDAVWGGSDAPISIVAFMDYQCPFTARSWKTLLELQRRYGADLRIVFKHNPLPFHPRAQPAAVAAQVVLALAGDQAFAEYSAQLFANQKALTPNSLEEWAGEAGLDRARFGRELRNPTYAQQVAHDIDLARTIGATGTPAFRINGITLSGAQPLEKFTAIIDEELPKARLALGNEGDSWSAYVARTLANHQAPPRRDTSSKTPKAPDLTTWKLPVGRSPVFGPRDALITIVLFSEFQCPFCKRVVPTLDQLMQKYPNDIRIVFKHNPLPFHQRAKPAANFSIYAFKKGGHKKFFEVMHLLFESQPKLEDADLEAIARQAGLSPTAALAAVKADRYAAIIDADQQLASDFEARGTPQMFINGRRIKGSQPLETFVDAVEERLATARALVGKGVPRSRVYATIMKSAKGPPPPDQKSVGRAPKDAPVLGPKHARLVIHWFSDLQCPYCSRVYPTLEQLLKRFPHQIKIVWRHLPLVFHKRAAPAAAAALEAKAQKGNRAFWQMVELIYQSGRQLEDADLESYASKLGLNLRQFRAAMQDGRHQARIDSDADVAKAANITGTPAFVIGGYFLSGAQPLPAFEKLVRYALKHPAPKP